MTCPISSAGCNIDYLWFLVAGKHPHTHTHMQGCWFSIHHTCMRTRLLVSLMLTCYFIVPWYNIMCLLFTRWTELQWKEKTVCPGIYLNLGPLGCDLSELTTAALDHSNKDYCKNNSDHYGHSKFISRNKLNSKLFIPLRYSHFHTTCFHRSAVNCSHNFGVIIGKYVN